MIKYLRVDLLRLLRDWHFYGAVAGITVLFFFSLESRGIRGSVLDTYIAAVNGSGIHAAGSFCSFAYAVSICEDFEHKYFLNEIIRGNTKKYLLSKLLSSYFGAMAAMLGGTILFCVLCRIAVPWVQTEDSVISFIRSGNYSNLVGNGQCLLYCAVFSMQLGMYMGLLTAASAFLTLFTTNVALLLIFPVLLDQLLIEIPGNNFINYIEFCPIIKRFDSDVLTFLYLAGVSSAIFILIFYGMNKQIKRRM